MPEVATTRQVPALQVALRARPAPCAQPTLPLAWEGRGPTTADRPQARVMRRTYPASKAGSAGGLPEPGAWLVALLQTVREVVTGDRPRQQLRRWVGGEVYEWLGRVSGAAGTIPLGALRSVHVCQPAPGVVEATALVSGGGRVRAVAVRLEAVQGSWRCSRLDLL